MQTLNTDLLPRKWHHDLCEWTSSKVWWKLLTWHWLLKGGGQCVSVKVSYIFISPVLHCFQLPGHQRPDAHLCSLALLDGSWFLLSCFVYLEMFTQSQFYLLDEDSFLHVDSSLSRATDWWTFRKSQKKNIKPGKRPQTVQKQNTIKGDEV